MHHRVGSVGVGVGVGVGGMRRESAPAQQMQTLGSIHQLSKEEHKMESIDVRLGEQFRYFRKEFIDAAIHHGVTVPLDILEDTTGRIFNFVKHQGPKYVFQTIQSNGDNTHLLRCALSLLIVSLSVLKRRLPGAAGTSGSGSGSHPSSPQALPHGVVSTAWMENHPSVTQWAESALNQISDGGAVNICVSLIMTTHDPTVQELTLTLLASIVSTSAEASAQMFLPPNSYSRQVGKTNRRGQESSNQNINSPPPQDNNSNNNNSNNNNMNSNNVNNNSTNNGNPLGKKRVSISATRERSDSSADVSSPISTAGVSSLSVEDMSAPGTCLSLILSVSALHRNRHLIMAGCAETIIALTSGQTNNKDLCEAVMRTPTCPLPVDHGADSFETKRKNEKKTQSSSFKSSSSSSSKVAKQLKSVVASADPTMFIDNAGIKILFKFLSRFYNFNSSDVSQFVPSREQTDLAFSYVKVFQALSQLIQGSSKVVDFIANWPGAMETYMAAAKKVCGQPAGQSFVDMTQACLIALHQKARQLDLSRGLGNTRLRASESLSDHSNYNNNNYNNNYYDNNNNNSYNNSNNNNNSRSPSRGSRPNTTTNQSNRSSSSNNGGVGGGRGRSSSPNSRLYPADNSYNSYNNSSSSNNNNRASSPNLQPNLPNIRPYTAPRQFSEINHIGGGIVGGDDIDTSMIKYTNMGISVSNSLEHRPMTGPARVPNQNHHKYNSSNSNSNSNSNNNKRILGASSNSHNNNNSNYYKNNNSNNNSSSSINGDVLDGGASNSLDLNNFFSNLPNTPNLPPRLAHDGDSSSEARQKLKSSHGSSSSDPNQKQIYEAKVDQIADRAVNKLKDMGLMYNGKPYLAREEIYRRAYTPDLPLSASIRSGGGGGGGVVEEEGGRNSRNASRQVSYSDEVNPNDTNYNKNTNNTTSSNNSDDIASSDYKGISNMPTNKAGLIYDQMNNTSADNNDNFGFFKQASAGIGFKMNEISFEESDMIAGFKPIYEISDKTLAKQSFRIENDDDDDDNVDDVNDINGFNYGKFNWNATRVEDGDIDDYRGGDGVSLASFHNKDAGIHLSTAEISSDVHM